MKSTTITLTSLLAALSVAIAQPHGHGHQHAHKRDIVWVTDYDYVTETVGYITTIWVSSGYVPPTTESSSASVTPVPAEFFQGADSSQPVAAASTPSTSSSVYVAPTQPSVAPVESSTSTPVADSTTPTPAAESTPAPAVAAAPAPAPAASSPASSGSSTGTCSSASPCEGDITYYQAGLGACGWTNDGDTENVVALPHGLMGTQSNGNPYCGMTITIMCTATGKTTTAKVVDKCMGCDGYAIDLSNAAFLELDDLSVGRTPATWHFN